MSINHFVDKIKGQMGIDTTTFVCLLVIVLVGFSSFGLGRLSVINSNAPTDIILEDSNTIVVKGEIGEQTPSEIILNDNLNQSKEKLYVASKNGKLYYTVNCSGAKRISPKNEVWFSSTTEAVKAGYTLSSSCK